MTTPTRHVLTPEAVERACTTARTGDVVSTLVTVWRELGFDLLSDDCPEVKPWEHAIPDDQWQTVCQALIEGSANAEAALGKINHGLDWMNKGPSSYIPESPMPRGARVEP